METTEHLIIGAGMTGLWLGHLLNQQNKSCQVIDKSKGVGGRMATRRWNDQKFDHGAQFYKLKSESQAFHQLMTRGNLVRSIGDDKWIALDGISQLAKHMLLNLTISLQKTVDKIIQLEGGIYQVTTLEGDIFSSKKLILTCPLPQTLKILDQSHFTYPKSLSNLQYSKAIVFLLSSKNVVKFPYPNPYVEPQDSCFFSVADQNFKTGNPGSAWTVTMNPNWSDQYFDGSEEDQLSAFKKEFKHFDSSFEFQVKKWRYSHPNQSHISLTGQIEGHPYLYLAGDAFGGGSLNGAIRSAENTFKLLN